MKKKIILIVGAVVIAVTLAMGSFWGGMAYQSNQAAQIQSNFFSARGGQPPDNFPADGSQFQGRGPSGEILAGRGTTGEVKSVDGDTLTLSTAQDVVTIHLSDSIEIEKTVSGTIDDLKPGTNIMVVGEQEDDGSITASQVQILSGSRLFPFIQSTGTAP
ncbi:MAG: hypothetical protein EHM70_17380 [Chloroflexota bacterium]|nr:MAG: hypothetical protein EHM70_17380 [Chloroflexota bacterium]